MNSLNKFQSGKYYSLQLILITVVIAVTLFVSCSQEDNDNTFVSRVLGYGTIEVITRTTGIGSDPDGYMVALNSGSPVAIGVNDTVYFKDLPVYGGRTERIELSDIESICSTNPYRIVPVLVDDTVTVNFNVNCSISPGSIRVSVTTSGSSPDDSYYIVIDGNDSTLVNTGIPLPNTVEVFLDNILPGSHQVTLVDVAGNCSILSENNPQTVEIVSNETTDVFFSVSCVGGSGAVDVVYVAEDPSYMPQIWVMDSSGNSRIQLTSGSDEVGVPRFSPDGTQIGYYRSMDNGSGIMLDAVFIMNTDGTNKTNVTGPADLSMGNFCWSSDGTKIAGFGQKLDSLDFQAKLYTLDLNSNTVAEVPITDFHLFSGYYAIDWSPDGSRFIFHASGPGGSAWTDIYTVPENGGIATVLAADPTGGNGFFYPKYSPDGSMIAMQESFGAGIWIMSNEGGSLTKILTSATGGSNPDWLPNGQEIGYTGSFQGGIVITDLSGNIVDSIATDIQIYNHEWNKN